jgi:hypothetical protein
LSPFITGTTVFDPLTSEPRTLNDLARRREPLPLHRVLRSTAGRKHAMVREYFFQARVRRSAPQDRGWSGRHPTG